MSFFRGIFLKISDKKTAAQALVFEKIALSLGALFFGFFIGKMQLPSATPNEVIETVVQPEISVVVFEKAIGDSLYADISGPVRIVWGDVHMAETQGENQIPLGQIPNEQDLEYRKFAFVGNEKTGKFYPSDTYWARGVAIEYRRFFATKDAAISAGFVPSKSVK